MSNNEVMQAFLRHMQSILDNDVETYRQTVSEDLSLYEWWVTPHRIEGIPFHEFMMNANASRGSVFGVESVAPASVRFDYANLLVQHYGDTAILSYTLLVSSSARKGVEVSSHHESRVMVKMEGVWKVVHVHKSPAWAAPHLPPVHKEVT